MDFKDAFVQSGMIFLGAFVIGLIVLFSEKHEKGEYDWKEFSKFAIYGMVLALARFIGGFFFGKQ